MTVIVASRVRLRDIRDQDDGDEVPVLALPAPSILRDRFSFAIERARREVMRAVMMRDRA